MGVFAVAMVVINSLEQLADTGLRPALIQRQKDISPHILPVRTVNALRGVLLGLVVFFTAPLIAKFFHSPESINIVRVIAVIPIITGLEPLYLILAQRDLKFEKVVKLQLSGGVIGLFVGVAYAYFKPDAWALLWSTMANYTVITVGAHLLSPRNNLGFSIRWGVLRELSRFGFWVMINRQISFAYYKGSSWFIGRLLNVKELALYQMSALYSTTIVTELGTVIGQLAFPVFSRLQDDKPRLIRAYQESFGLVSIVTFLMAALTIGCAHDLFTLILGEQWVGSIPLVPWLTIAAVCKMFNQPQGSVLRALGRVELVTKVLIYRSVLLLLLLYPLIKWSGIVGAAMATAWISVLSQLMFYRVISKLLDISYYSVIKHAILPAIAFSVAAYCGMRVRGYLPTDNHIIPLFVAAITVLAAYLIILWLGKRWLEPSPEDIVKRVKSLFLNFKSNRSKTL